MLAEFNRIMAEQRRSQMQPLAAERGKMLERDRAQKLQRRAALMNQYTLLNAIPQNLSEVTSRGDKEDEICTDDDLVLPAKSLSFSKLQSPF